MDKDIFKQINSVIFGKNTTSVTGISIEYAEVITANNNNKLSFNIN